MAIYRPILGRSIIRSIHLDHAKIHWVPGPQLHHFLPDARPFSSSRSKQDTQHGRLSDQACDSALGHRGDPKRRWKAPSFVLTAVIVSVALYSYTQLIDPPANVLDKQKFHPYTIVKREEVSSTSIIITLRPHVAPAQSLDDPYGESWDKGIWSVEFKQPELQIARRYTPLPPIKGDKDGYLRFLIRKEHKGEVSSYLHGLPLGSKIEVRGPQTELDFSNELREVIFLAGGTGIAPALQTAYTLLERRKGQASALKIHIVWANRRREDCEGNDVELSDNPGYISGRKTGLVVRQLKEMQAAYPGQLEVDYMVDEERKFINKSKISDLAGPLSSLPILDDSKMLLVSGPEGFVNAVSGSKRWQDGKEVQGYIGGMLGQLDLKTWKIWKL